MRLASLAGRAVLIAGDRAVDVAEASDGRFGSDRLSAPQRQDEFVAWGRDRMDQDKPYDYQDLRAPVPNSAQVFGIRLNYRDHADEPRLAYPDDLVVFTKFASPVPSPR